MLGEGSVCVSEVVQSPFRANDVLLPNLDSSSAYVHVCNTSRSCNIDGIVWYVFSMLVLLLPAFNLFLMFTISFHSGSYVFIYVVVCSPQEENNNY